MIKWWGEFELEQDQPKAWVLGDRSFAIMKAQDEYCTWNIAADSALNDDIRIVDNLGSDSLDPMCMTRHLDANAPTQVSVKPRLADRSVVARPVATLRVLPRQKACISISTPLWFFAEAGHRRVTLIDTPIWRPSDSWFGPSNREGEMCYAKYTDARLHHDVLEHRPHRAITPITIANNSKEVLSIERINVPVPLLKLYSNSVNQLWTQALTITHEANRGTVEVQLEKGTPFDSDDAVRLAKARIDTGKHTIVRSITSLFS